MLNTMYINKSEIFFEKLCNWNSSRYFDLLEHPIKQLHFSFGIFCDKELAEDDTDQCDASLFFKVLSLNQEHELQHQLGVYFWKTQ